MIYIMFIRCLYVNFRLILRTGFFCLSASKNHEPSRAEPSRAEPGRAGPPIEKNRSVVRAPNWKKPIRSESPREPIKNVSLSKATVFTVNYALSSKKKLIFAMNYTLCSWELFWDLFGTGRGQWRRRAEPSWARPSRAEPERARPGLPTEKNRSVVL